MADIILSDPKGLLGGAELKSSYLTITFSEAATGSVSYVELNTISDESVFAPISDTITAEESYEVESIVGGVVIFDISSPAKKVSFGDFVGCESFGEGIKLTDETASVTVSFS